MAIIVGDSQNWENPSEGIHRAVCCDVVDLGEIVGQWGPRRMIQIRWQLEELNSEGKPMLLTRRFGASLSEKSTLRPFLETWRGRKFTEAELKAFDVERLIGVNCQIQVIYDERDGKIWANAQAIFPAAKGVEPLEVRDYIRVVDRPAEGTEQPTSAPAPAPHHSAPEAENKGGAASTLPDLWALAAALWGKDRVEMLEAVVKTQCDVDEVKALTPEQIADCCAHLHGLLDQKAAQATLV